MRREVLPTAATVRWMRGPAGVNPSAAQRPRVAGSSGRAASTSGAALVAGRADGLLEEGIRDPVGVVVGVDDQEVDRARRSRRRGPTDGGPGRPHRRRDAGSRPRRCWPAAGTRAAGADRRRRAGSILDRTRPSASLSATRRSISVIRAARTRYSTPKVRTSQDGDRSPLDRGHPDPGPGPGARDPAQPRVRDACAREGMRPTGIAFGSPVHMIRHRFGGHLRAARGRSCDASVTHRSLPRRRPGRAPSTGTSVLRVDGRYSHLRTGLGPSVDDRRSSGRTPGDPIIQEESA